jgi:hypothetical protein
MKHICQGPECHTYKTQSRIRGVKGSKVLRTRNARYDISDTQKNILGVTPDNWERFIFAMNDVCNNWLKKHMTHLMSYSWN